MAWFCLCTLSNTTYGYIYCLANTIKFKLHSRLFSIRIIIIVNVSLDSERGQQQLEETTVRFKEYTTVILSEEKGENTSDCLADLCKNLFTFRINIGFQRGKENLITVDGLSETLMFFPTAVCLSVYCLLFKLFILFHLRLNLLYVNPLLFAN